MLRPLRVMDVTLKGPGVNTVTSAARVSLKLCPGVKAPADVGVRLTDTAEATAISYTVFSVLSAAKSERPLPEVALPITMLVSKVNPVAKSDREPPDRGPT